MSKLVRKVDTGIHISPKPSCIQFNAHTLCYVHFEYVLKGFKRFYTDDVHARRDNNSVEKTNTQEPRKLVALTRKKEIRRRKSSSVPDRNLARTSDARGFDSSPSITSFIPAHGRRLSCI